MRKIIYNGDIWTADSTGGSYYADHQHSMGVRFWCQAKQKEVFGRLPVAPQDFAGAPDDMLTTSLAAALQSPAGSD